MVREKRLVVTRQFLNHFALHTMITGAYVIVYVTSVYVLLSTPCFTSSPTRMSMFGITTFMFALGTIALVLETTLEFQITQNFYDPFLPLFYYDVTFYGCYYTWATITCLMYILCDGICAWRTVVLWRNDKRVIAVLVFSILGTTAAAVCALVFGLIPDSAHSQIKNLTLGKFGLVVVGPTLATNLLSTGLVALRAWQRRIPVMGHLCEGGGFMRVDRVFALLIESGIIYCCIWIVYWISRLGLLLDPGFTAMVFFSGLYPTLIIIFISKKMSPIDQYSTDFTDSIDSEMRYTHVPSLEPPRGGDLPQHVLTIHRNSTNDSAAQIPSTYEAF